MRLGNDADAYSDINERVRSDIVDGGLFELDALSAGRYLTLRRDGGDPVTYFAFYIINHVRAYQTPNLFDALSG